MLRDEVEHYTKLTGEDGWQVPIIKVGAYLDGYDKGSEVLDKIKAEIREWYWQVDKQVLAKDPCVVDAMIDLFIRTINKYRTESETKNG